MARATWMGVAGVLVTFTATAARAADPAPVPREFRLPDDILNPDPGLPASGRWADEPLLAYGGHVVPPMESPRVKSSLPEAQPEGGKRIWGRALPIWGQKVIDRGIDLPNPYNLGFSLYLGNEHRDLHDLTITLNDGAPLDASFVDFQDSRIKSQSLQYQVGAWLFPFLNIYGILGYTQGKGDIDIAIPGDALMQFLGIGGCGLPPSSPLRPALCDTTLQSTAHADYDGYTYGVGFTAAGAYKDFFFSLPVTYVVSDVSMSEKKGRTWNITPRIGWNFHLPAGGLVTAYAGATYMISDIHIEGSFVFDTSSTVIGQDTTLGYSITVEPRDRWNYLTGAHWMINKTWSVLGEVGFGSSRKNFLVNVFYRF